MPTSIAATIVAAISLISVLLINHEVSAADALKQIAAANQTHKGWIHAKADQVPPPESGGPRATALSFHMNMEKQIYVQVIDRGAERTIEWIDRVNRTHQQYTSANHELVIAELSATPRFLRIQERMKGRNDLTPLQLTGFLVAQPTMESILELVDYGCTVARKEEGTHERFDLSLPDRKGPKGAKGGEPFLTALFDKQTKLLQRWSGTGTADGNVAAFSYTYGEPDLKGIQDLGVPPDAKMIDRRKGREKTTSQTREILDRLDARLGRNEKLGNYIAIETETILGDAGQSYKGAVLIYGRSDDKRFFGRYWKLSERKLTLDGWPTPGIAAVRSAQGERPDTAFVFDGARAWFTRADGTIQPWTSGLTYAERFLLSGVIWPGRWCIEVHGDPRLTVDAQDMRDGQHAGLKVIANGYAGIMPKGGFDQVEDQWQLDPARDDVPVTSAHILRTKDGAVFEETRTRYLDHAQLPGGVWYPTRWIAKTTPAGQAQPVTIEHRLQILSGQQLDPAWFTDPNPRFGKPQER